jgi:hypothetical protein
MFFLWPNDKEIAVAVEQFQDFIEILCLAKAHNLNK